MACFLENVVIKSRYIAAFMKNVIKLAIPGNDVTIIPSRPSRRGKLRAARNGTTIAAHSVNS